MAAGGSLVEERGVCMFLILLAAASWADRSRDGGGGRWTVDGVEQVGGGSTKARAGVVVETVRARFGWRAQGAMKRLQWWELARRIGAGV